MNKANIKELEFDKILNNVSEFAVLESTKKLLKNFQPETNFEYAKILLETTFEADKLLYNYGAGEVEYFDDVIDFIKRAKTGATLSIFEILKISSLLRSSRILKNSIMKSEFEDIKHLKNICEIISYDEPLENEIKDKILDEDKLADNASENLYNIRKKIKQINSRIREKLSSYLTKYSKYLQDSLITIRGERFVIPVKVEYKNLVRGFIHDQSASGSTVFIEPEQILELNNDLKSEIIAEKLEVDKILFELSTKISLISEKLFLNIEQICVVDSFYARAVYSYKNRCIFPKLNNRGYVSIVKGRHPLIEKNKVIPLTLNLGKVYNFLLISGPNTGGKTVTLKMTGLFVLMAMSGIFVPAADADLSVFENIYCDIGDSQSIENDLSTFSSHIKSVKNILENVNEQSLILIDELGDGTDPEEGQALAISVIKRLLEKNCKGIITTHFSSLKEFAFTNKKIVNASMDFDITTFSPMYKINIGLPGSSNALLIAKRLGISDDIIEDAKSLLSANKISFEEILNQAEKTRILSEKKLEEVEKLKAEILQTKLFIDEEKARIQKEKEKIQLSSNVEIRRIINEKVDEAEELIEEIKEISKKNNISSAEIITAKTLKNKLSDKKYNFEDVLENKFDNYPIDISKININKTIYVKSLDKNGIIERINHKKNEAEILIGSIKYKCKFSDMYESNNISIEQKNKKNSVIVNKKMSNNTPISEIKLLGKNGMEALIEVEQFMDKAVVDGLLEVKIIHGIGTGKLKKIVWDYLKTNSNVLEYRLGKYGEGEAGVTIVTLK